MRSTAKSADANAEALKSLAAFLFLSCTALFTFRHADLLPGPRSWPAWALLTALVISAFLRLRNTRLAIPALFFFVIYVTYPIVHLQLQLIPLEFAGARGVVPFTLFFLLLVLKQRAPAYLPGPKWEYPAFLGPGKRDLVSLLLVPATILISAIALAVWVKLPGSDLTRFRVAIPGYPLFVWAVLGILFAISNAFAEELLFRGYLFEGFSRLLPKLNGATEIPKIVAMAGAVVVGQAALFGLWHFRGFPGGASGMLLVTLWGLVLGLMRHRTGSIRLPLLTHFFADLVIFGLFLGLARGAD